MFRGKEDGKSRRMVHTEKVGGARTSTMEMALSDKVSKRRTNSVCHSRQDMCLTCEGRVLRLSDVLRSSGVNDG